MGDAATYSDKGRHTLNWAWLVLMFVLVATLAGCGRGISGQYIAKFTNGIAWLQLVETDDHHLTGNIETISFDSDGKVSANTSAVIGAVNGADVSLTIKSTELLSTTVVASGTRDGDKLTLTGSFQQGSLSTVILSRSDLAEYQKLSASVNAQAQKVRTDKAAAEAWLKREEHERAVIGELTETGSQMARFVQASGAVLTKLETVSARYQEITNKMGQWLGREQILAGDQRAGVARSQIVVTMNQGPISSDQIHIQVQGIDRDLHSRAERLGPKADAAIAACHRQYQPTVGDPAAPGGDAWNSACRSVLDNEDGYWAGFRNLRAKLDGLEETYRAERGKQDQYLQAANRIQ